MQNVMFIKETGCELKSNQESVENVFIKKQQHSLQ